MNTEKKAETAGILGVGYCLPDKVFTNQDFEKIGISPDFIEFYFGIKERRYAIDQTYSDLAVKAAQNAMENAGIRPDEVDMIISNSSTNDHFVPHAGCLLQNLLGLRPDVMVLNTNVICCGMNYGMSIASKFISSGLYKTVLLITGDVWFRMSVGHSPFSGMFGDGVGAVVLRALKPEYKGILAETYGSQGDLYEVMGLFSLGSCDNNYNVFHDGDFDVKVDLKKGANIPLLTVKWFKECFEKCLEQSGLKKEEIDFVSPHPVSIPQIHEQLKSMDISEEKSLIITQKIGHCTAGTAAIVLAEAVRLGKVKPGNLVYSFNVAAGYQYGGIIYRFPNRDEFIC
jgi:3-oxoacyl-[acyl-carrier-protein] synthase-3